MLYIMTIGEIRNLLGINDTREDLELESWAEPLQGRLANHCRRRFFYKTVTEDYEGGGRYLYLRRYPIDTVSSVTIGVDTIAVSAIEINERRGKVAYGHVWPMDTVTLTYTGGLIQSDGSAAPNADEEDVLSLKRAFGLQLNYEWRNRKTLGLSQVSQQGVSLQSGMQPSLAMRNMTLLPEVQSTLQPLRRML